MAVITETYVDSLAPHAGAMKNGRELVKKTSFSMLCETEDGTGNILTVSSLLIGN